MMRVVLFVVLALACLSSCYRSVNLDSGGASPDSDSDSDTDSDSDADSDSDTDSDSDVDGECGDKQSELAWVKEVSGDFEVVP